VRFKARRFFIDESVDFFARKDRERYWQTKENQVLILKDIRFIDVPTSEQDLLFNEGG
jgi:hypothetical protein